MTSAAEALLSVEKHLTLWCQQKSGWYLRNYLLTVYGYLKNSETNKATNPEHATTCIYT